MQVLPSHIGPYAVRRVLGKGGMGVVYLAFDEGLHRPVAIKVLRDSTGDPDQLARFRREARLIARLRHANIVQIYAIGEHEQQPYLAMEYIEGETLADAIRRRVPWTVQRKLQLCAELCAALAFAHRAGVIHRDVKPSNIIVEQDSGALRLLDFGIARGANQGATKGLTVHGGLIGTLNYMSPEQISGEVIDHRSDIFSAGLLIYELLTYQMAFPGDDLGPLTYRIVNGSPQPLRALRPDLDEELCAVVERALARAPADRHPHFDALRDDLLRIASKLSRPAAIHAQPDATAQTPVAPAPRFWAGAADPTAVLQGPVTPQPMGAAAVAREEAPLEPVAPTVIVTRPDAARPASHAAGSEGPVVPDAPPPAVPTAGGAANGSALRVRPSWAGGLRPVVALCGIVMVVAALLWLIGRSRSRVDDQAPASSRPPQAAAARAEAVPSGPNTAGGGQPPRAPSTTVAPAGEPPPASNRPQASARPEPLPAAAAAPAVRSQPARTRATTAAALPPASPPPPAPMQPVRVGGNIAPPRKVRDVKPVYPQVAQAAGVAGVVIIEATIGPDGKVQHARVLRSIPMLDEAALEAVRQWEYAPTLLTGVPVPVIMTVTVNFAMQAAADPASTARSPSAGSPVAVAPPRDTAPGPSASPRATPSPGDTVVVTFPRRPAGQHLTVAHGPSSWHPPDTRKVIRTSDEWRAFWRTLPTKQAAPDIDFTRATLFAIVGGAPAQGRPVVDSIVEEGAETVVNWRTDVASGGTGSRPFLVVALQRPVTGPVRFNQVR